MSVALRDSAHRTVHDLLAIPEEQRFHEIIDGELIQKAMPSAKHGGVQAAANQLLRPYNRSTGGSGGPGGWRFAVETEIMLAADQVYRPDVAGWRRERLPELPTSVPVRLRPDWVCEVLSPGNARNDTVKKLRAYHRYQVPNYWIVDPVAETLTIHRFTESGYLLVLVTKRGERVRAEPFDAIGLQVGVLFGDDEEAE